MSEVQQRFGELVLNARLSRRAVAQRAAALGVSGVALSALLAACGGSSTPKPAATTGSGSSSGSSATSSSSTTSSSAGSSTDRKPKTGGTYVFGAWQDADMLDPHTTGLAATSRILIQIYDALVWSNPEDKKLYPGLAEKWGGLDRREGIHLHAAPGREIPQRRAVYVQRGQI